jgi:SAM-dependent methyltransferase
VVLDLGETPLANALLTREQLHLPEPRFPLRLAFCSECGLLQITEIVPPEILFRSYFYFSSFSDAVLRASEQSATRLISERGLNRESLVLEIASNDGYLLQFYKQQGIPVLGIEPAANVAKAAREMRGIPTIDEFFGWELARRLFEQSVKADVIHANNVLAHTPDLDGFLSGLRLILKNNGIAVIEVPYARDMIDQVEFDTIYHEHLYYFSLTALDYLCGAHGLRIAAVEHLAVHGGSLRVFLEHEGETPQRATNVQELMLAEERQGLKSPTYYDAFAGKVHQLRGQLLVLLRDIKKAGHRIAAYGASAKGSTLLNCFEIDERTLDFVVDRNTVKQGLFTPGTHLPICSPAKLLDDMPEYTLLLTWNFAEEILAQQAEYLRRGGHFIVPIPEPQVI